MLLGRSLVERHPWNAFTAAEDLEYSLALRLEGVRPVFAPEALVRGPVPASRAAGQIQRERWEGGRYHVLRKTLPHLLAEIVLRRKVSLLDAAVDLLVLPLGLLMSAALAGSMLTVALGTLHLMSFWLLTPWVVALVGLVGFVLLGLRAAGAPRWMYQCLLSTPRFLVHKIAGTVGVVRSRPADTWVRTERPSEVVS
jgi:cellulose synthase/poly-beta-1,6-N-acetylglucosamine synthase-like glycosyltransferase